MCKQPCKNEPCTCVFICFFFFGFLEENPCGGQLGFAGTPDLSGAVPGPAAQLPGPQHTVYGIDIYSKSREFIFNEDQLLCLVRQWDFVKQQSETQGHML